MSPRKESSRSPQRFPEADRQTNNQQPSYASQYRSTTPQEPQQRKTTNRPEYEASNRQSYLGRPSSQSNLESLAAKGNSRFSQQPYRQPDVDRPQQKQVVDMSNRRSRSDLKRSLYNTKTWQSLAVIAFICALAILALGFAMFVCSHAVRNPFCNSDGKLNAADCDPCPLHGVCKEGRLVDCSGRYVRHDDLCVDKDKKHKLIYYMYREAVDLLERAFAEHLLGNKADTAGLTAEVIEEYLYQRHHSDPDYWESFRESMSLMRTNSREVTAAIRQGTTVFTAMRGHYSYYGWLKLFARKHPLLIAMCVFALLGSLVIIWRQRDELRLRRFGEEGYRLAKTYVISDPHRQRSETDIKRWLAADLKLTRLEVADIWPYVSAEAESRHIDFFRKIQDGGEQTFWCIDRKEYS